MSRFETVPNASSHPPGCGYLHTWSDGEPAFHRVCRVPGRGVVGGGEVRRSRSALGAGRALADGFGCCLGTVVESELGQDAGDVLFDGAATDVEAVGDVGVR